MKNILFTGIFLCIVICKTNAQIVDLSIFSDIKKARTESFSKKLQHMKDSLAHICNIYELEDFKYKLPTIYLGESMKSLKTKSKEFEKIGKEIEDAIKDRAFSQRRADSIRQVKESERIAQKKIADSLYLIQAATTWEWLHDNKGKWEEVNRIYPKEEHYKVNTLFPKYHVIDNNAYLDGKLVGVCIPTKNNKDQTAQDNHFRKRMMNFLCQQDFLNNKYNIQKESPKTLEYIKVELGLKKKLNPSDSPVLKEIVSNANKLKLAQERLRKGEISLETYRRLKTKLGANTSNSVMQTMSESESPEIKAGKSFLEQLHNDNLPLINKYTIKRIDGTNFIYSFSNSEGEKTLSVQVSFFINKEEKIEYTISSIQKH